MLNDKRTFLNGGWQTKLLGDINYGKENKWQNLLLGRYNV